MTDKEQRVYVSLTKAYNRITKYQLSGKVTDHNLLMKIPPVKGEIESRMYRLSKGLISDNIASRALDYPDTVMVLKECEKEGF